VQRRDKTSTLAPAGQNFERDPATAVRQLPP
jgi:hypothetical protein